MRAWAFLLGGMIVWTVHFFMLYIIASIFLTSTLSRTLTLLVTLLCLAADGLLLARAARLKRDRQMHGVSSWMNSLATLFAALRSEEHTSELQSLMRISYAVFCLKKNNVTQDYLSR